MLTAANSTGGIRLRDWNDPSHDGEASLIAAYLRGEEPAIHYVTRHTQAVVRKFPPLLEQAHDITQDVHFRLFKNLANGEFDRRSSLGYYVRRITLYVCIDEMRRAKPTESLEGRDRPPAILSKLDDTLDRLARKEDVDNVLWCLEQISRMCRDILRLRFWEEKSHGEIAELMDAPVYTSRGRLRRCLAKLRALFLERKKRNSTGLRTTMIEGGARGGV